MSFIPDVRHKTNEFNTPYHPEEGKNEPNDYWQGYMNDAGVEEMKTYDFVVDEVMCFFDNLDCYSELEPLSEDFANKIKNCLADWLERRRDEYGVSILDDMSEEEYDTIRKAVDAGERHNYCTDMEDDEEGKEDESIH